MRIKNIIKASHTKLKVRRWAAFLLCAALVGGMVSSALPAMAAVDADGEVNEDNEDNEDNEVSVTAEDGEAGEEIYCEHHTEHTEECGYVETVEGQPCTHEHNEECGYAEGDGEQPCTHKHDEECGYVEAVEGQPCQFVCDICGGGSEEAAEELEESEEDSEQIAAMSDVMPLAEVNEKGLIAYFTFDDSSDRLHNSSSGSNVTATLNNVNNGAVIDDANLGDYIVNKDGHPNALRLDDNEYLALGNTEAFNGLKELTVEMSVYISEEQLQNWLFYARPGNADAGDCLGAAILPRDVTSGDPNTRFRAIRGNNKYMVDWISPSVVLAPDSWHTIKVLYKISSMALYVDGRRVLEQGAGGKTADFFTNNPDIWIGHSAFPDHNFKGYIDDIKIYNYAKDDYPIDEQKYIITEDVQDPENTTVHMFDYWITEQTENDFDPALSSNGFLGSESGINANHLFLFAGYNVSTDRTLYREETIGSWNDYFAGAYHATYEPYSGIVRNVLDDGYPKLAIDQLINDKRANDIPSPLSDRSPDKQTESLAYLFDPGETNKGKASYPNVTGLFRLNEKGYYYFTSATTFAELNREQVNRPKTSTGDNKITLYARNSADRDFFPFNDGTDLFYVKDDGNLDKANLMEIQAKTDEPLNHYFGMTVETNFKQPENGLIDHSGGREPMEFSFSGDDDVWIFIDDVLVADLGGLHQELSVTIDFSTGKIDFTGSGGQKLDGSDDGGGRMCFDTTFRERFELAGRVNSIEWNEDNNELFADGSKHTLKFFYLERGNSVSRCAISFNVQYDDEKQSRSRRSYEEQLPEEIEILDVSAEMPAGVLASPHTGDSKMVVMWITLLVCSITGVIVLHRTRKRANKH